MEGSIEGICTVAGQFYPKVRAKGKIILVTFEFIKSNPMEAIEFSVRGTSENKIQIPNEYQNLIKPDDNLRIIILIEHNKDENDWK